MQAKQLLHKLLQKSLPTIHIKRINAVINAVQSLLIGKELTLTQLGRHMSGYAKERHNIRKVDRLLANPKLHAERIQFYQAKANYLLSKVKQVIVSVDWSATDKRKDFHILRASISVQGRSEAIYEEVHEDCQLNSHIIHKAFLQNLKLVLPPQTHAVIITDAAFCNPWFKEVKRCGWDFVGRTKSSVSYTLCNDNSWKKCDSLYQKAKNIAEYIGPCLLAKTNRMLCHIVTYKSKIKGRVHRTRSGKKTQSTQSQRISIRQRTPWVLITSLGPEQAQANDIVKIYQTRMQIEEGFRDTKSVRYGFCLRQSLSKCPRRIEILLLIAMLATFICWIIAIDAKGKNQHYHYQANTIKIRNVLSVVYLGCQLVRRKYHIKLREIIKALKKFRHLVTQNAFGLC